MILYKLNHNIDNYNNSTIILIIYNIDYEKSISLTK